MLRKILPHAAIIISMMYFVFFFIDRVNSAMAFINNGMTKGLLFILCMITIINALMLIADDRRRTRARSRRSAPQRSSQPRREAQPHYSDAYAAERRNYRRYD